MKLVKAIFNGLLLIALLSSVNSCINDDKDACSPREFDNYYLAFDYYRIFSQHINNVNINIYDSLGVCINNQNVNKSDLTKSQGVNLSLNEGKYTVVCWGNAFDNTDIINSTPGNSFAAAYLTHPNLNGSLPIPTNDSLYYSKTQIHISNTSVRQTGTAVFKPAHVKLFIKIVGLLDDEGKTKSFVRINNLKPVYDFDMNTKGNLVSYYPGIKNIKPQNNEYFVHCDVLRFPDINPITIDVVENPTTNNILSSKSLQALMSSAGINIIDGQEAIITITFHFDTEEVIVEVGVTPWGENPTDPDFN